MSFDYASLIAIATAEFADIVTEARKLNENIRLYLRDGTYVDVWYSARSKEQRFAFHWERRRKDGAVWRHNNVPDAKWSHIKSFPKHFHAGREENVVESNLSDDPPTALREFLTFVRDRLQHEEK
jgi:hypothetical protein